MLCVFTCAFGRNKVFIAMDCAGYAMHKGPPAFVDFRRLVKIGFSTKYRNRNNVGLSTPEASTY